MKGKKTLKLMCLSALLVVGSLATINTVNTQAEDVVSNLNTLVEKYYNEGSYVKGTTINLTAGAVNELKTYNKGFHAGASTLVRTTYYEGNALWMSRGNGTYSYYGTDEAGNLTSGSSETAKVAPETVTLAVEKGTNTETGTWHDEVGGMEGYYITLKDVVASEAHAWTVEEGVYSSSSEEVIEWFKAITAPCYLGFQNDTSNYIDLERVEIAEVENALELRLYANSGDNTKLTNEDNLFSLAVIETGEHAYHVYAPEYSSSAEGHYHTCLFCDVVTEAEAHECAAKEVWAQGRTCDVCGYAMSAEKAMLAEFTFENKLANTGVDSSVRGTLVSNVTATRYQEVTDDSQLISDKFTSTVLKTYHNGSGNSFAVKGLNTGTGDFSIVMKYAMSSTASNFYDKKDQFLVMGTNTETITGQAPAKPCFAIRVGKDSSGAGYGRLTVVLNGESVKKLHASSGDVQGGYFKSNTLVEISLVKKGTTVTVHVDCPLVSGQTKCAPYTLTYTLASPEDLMITPDQVLGFGCNYGVARPGNDSYVDDIRVYNYAIDLDI